MSDDLLAALLSEQEEKCEHVTIPRDHWNRLVEIAGRNYQIQHAQQQLTESLQEHPKETWYPCRYGHGCKAQYKNSPSNRTRHEKQAHNYIHKENGHES